MEVVTKWPALIDAIKRAGHKPVFPHITRCGEGYCLAGFDAESKACGFPGTGAIVCEHFAYREPH